MEALNGAYMELRSLVIDLFSFIRIQVANISLTDVIDILLMAFLLAWAYRFVRGRRAAKLIMGIVVLMAVLAVGRLFHLYTVGFLFDYIFQAGMVAIVILFQPELRDALERMGEEPLRGLKGLGENGGASETKAWIRDVCEASADMARSHTGALMVLERTAQLTDIVRSGIEVDGKMSPSLLRNIFFNKSPMHDGAVVIRGGRVFAAGCLLPLTRRGDVDQELGTRHRAAIGMSEVSDALIIVISEETGRISVVEKGIITRDYTAQTLQALLMAVFMPKEKELELAEVVDDGFHTEEFDETAEDEARDDATAQESAPKEQDEEEAE